MISSDVTFRSRSLATGTGDDARPIYSATDSTNTQVGNFINADFAIVYDFDVEADDRFADCFISGRGSTWTVDSQTCDQASTYDLVKSFAEVIIFNLIFKSNKKNDGNHFRIMICGSWLTMKLMT